MPTTLHYGIASVYFDIPAQLKWYLAPGNFHFRFNITSDFFLIKAVEVYLFTAFRQILSFFGCVRKTAKPQTTNDFWKDGAS